jgi:DNA-binding MarR family transcriptional regulator
MLSKKERAVMNVIYEKCHSENNCLITTQEIANELPKNRKLTEGAVENIVRSLELDDYFDIVFSERKGQPVLCVNLHAKGLSFKRELVQFRRTILTKLMLAVMSAATTFVIGRILFFLFS